MGRRGFCGRGSEDLEEDPREGDQNYQKRSFHIIRISRFVCALFTCQPDAKQRKILQYSNFTIHINSTGCKKY